MRLILVVLFLSVFDCCAMNQVLLEEKGKRVRFDADPAAGVIEFYGDLDDEEANAGMSSYAAGVARFFPGSENGSVVIEGLSEELRNNGLVRRGKSGEESSSVEQRDSMSTMANCMERFSKLAQRQFELKEKKEKRQLVVSIFTVAVSLSSAAYTFFGHK